VVQWGVAGTLPTAPCYGDLFVTQLNSNLNGFFDKLGNEFLLRSLQEFVTHEVEKRLEERKISVSETPLEYRGKYCSQCGVPHCKNPLHQGD